MKFLALCLLITSVATEAAAAGTRPRFQILISTQTPRVTLGQAIEIAITLKNNSDRVLDDSANWQEATGADPWWHLIVRDSEGKPVPPRNYKGLAAKFGKVVNRKVGPGGAITDRVDLRRIFDLRSPGKYRVQVNRKIPKENGGGIIKSNVITITVTR